jgi:hypothetical protein
VNHVQPKGYSFLWLVIAASIMLWSGCSLREPLQSEPIGDFGRIEFRDPNGGLDGVVVGASHGLSEPVAVEYATALSDKTGAGLVVAYGFDGKRIPVTQPLDHAYSIATTSQDPRRRGSVYPEFKALLRKVTAGQVKFYVGVRVAKAQSDLSRIEVASTGFTFEQIRSLKESFVRIRDRELEGTAASRIDLAVDPLDQMSWQVDGIKHHGVLMLAVRGFNIYLPSLLSAPDTKRVYQRIFFQWVIESIDMASRNPAGLPEIEIAVFPYGKIESIRAKRGAGIVIGAPHGSFDFQTASTVRQISFRSGLAAVIAKGFSPAETGSGWRINVNRPSERRYPGGLREIETARSAEIYRHYRNAVIKSAQGKLDLYIDIHQNNGSRIEVATVGISEKEARLIKSTYISLRERALEGRLDMAVVDLAIEPLDVLEVPAWAAKNHGILAVPKKSLHFELPSDGFMGSVRHRKIYTQVLAELVTKLASQIAKGK